MYSADRTLHANVSKHIPMLYVTGKKARGTCNTGSPARRDVQRHAWLDFAGLTIGLEITATTRSDLDTRRLHHVRPTNILSSSPPVIAARLSIALLLVAITVTSNVRTTLVRSRVTQGCGNSENAVLLTFLDLQRLSGLARVGLHYLITFYHEVNILSLWF